MSMKEAFDVYFSKLKETWAEDNGCLPKIPYNEKYQPLLKKDLFIPGTYEKGYVQWLPKLQTESIDFDKIEEKLWLSISLQIKEYFSTYWFMTMKGTIGEDSFNLTTVQPGMDILSLVEMSRKK